MMGDISTLGALEDRLCSALASTSIDGGKAQALPSAMAIRIGHVDLDAFFVEVCRQRYPELRDVELLVVGGRRDQRGVVQSASYAARKAGVRSGMPIAEAVRRCPGATFFQGDFRYYRDASRAVAAILHDFSPTVVMASLDEAYLDFTGTERQHPVSLLPEAARMKDRIRAETGLACSVGIGTNRMIAKLASDYAKPRGLMEVRAGWEAGFLAGLPLAALPGVGPRTAERWRELGLTGVAQVQAMSEAALIRLLGKDAVLLRRRAFGQGGTTLTADRLPRSVSRETTLSRDERDAKRLEGLLLLLTARVAAQLREEQLMGRTVTLKLRHDDFITVTRRHTLPEPTNLDQELASAAQTLFRKAFAEVRGRDRGVRLIGVAVTGITPVESLDLFEPPARTRLRQLTAAVDAVREKFGFEAVTPGRLVEFKRGRKA
jgi:DNA polymerase-4